jgi:hypothetical protein
MKNLDQIDPLPEFKGTSVWFTLWEDVLGIPASRRHIKEHNDKVDRSVGDDWRPTDNPLIEVNGKGQMRTKGYQPPEPPETDIPVGCVLQTVAPLSSREMYLEYQRVEQEAGIEAAARKLVELSGYRGEPLRWRTPDGRSIDMGFDGWYPHKPGDPMPCDPVAMVWIRKPVSDERAPHFARSYNWGVIPDSPGYEISAWKPAT